MSPHSSLRCYVGSSIACGVKEKVYAYPHFQVTNGQWRGVQRTENTSNCLKVQTTAQHWPKAHDTPLLGVLKLVGVKQPVPGPQI
eukprot:2576510-Alexandrium_andersonii.AAC.1